MYVRNRPCSCGQRWQELQLLVHREEVEGVPSFGNLAILDPPNDHAPELHGFPGGARAGHIAQMSTRHMAVCGDHVAVDQSALDINVDIWECDPECAIELLERLWASNGLTAWRRKTVNPGVHGQQSVDGRLLTSVP